MGFSNGGQNSAQQAAITAAYNAAVAIYPGYTEGFGLPAGGLEPGGGGPFDMEVVVSSDVKGPPSDGILICAVDNTNKVVTLSVGSDGKPGPGSEKSAEPFWMANVNVPTYTTLLVLWNKSGRPTGNGQWAALKGFPVGTAAKNTGKALSGGNIFDQAEDALTTLAGVITGAKTPADLLNVITPEWQALQSAIGTPVANAIPSVTYQGTTYLYKGFATQDPTHWLVYMAMVADTEAAKLGSALGIKTLDGNMEFGASFENYQLEGPAAQPGAAVGSVTSAGVFGQDPVTIATIIGIIITLAPQIIQFFQSVFKKKSSTTAPPPPTTDTPDTTTPASNNTATYVIAGLVIYFVFFHKKKKSGEGAK